MRLAILLLAAQIPLEMGLPEYRLELDRIASLLESGEIAPAQTAAGALRGLTIAGPVPFTADGSLLAPVGDLAAGQNPRPLIARLRAASSSLDGAQAPSAPRESDYEALAAIRDSWDVELQEGRTDLHLPRVKSPPEWLIDRMADALNTLERWFRAAWKAIFGRELKPREKGMGAAEGTVALVALACGVFAVLAFRAYRARRLEPVGEMTEEVREVDRDEDPTSRQPSEWEQHADTLARAGRYREAIRAWYHAVLAATFSRGYITYAKGRTNWEYVAALSPGLRFRNDVIAMTQAFEGCWYGGREASPQILSEQKKTAQAILVILATGGRA